MIYLTEPENFNPKFTLVSCFIEYNDQILLLHRQDTKFEGNTWAIPAGKVGLGEKISEALCREIKEETGIIINALEVKQIRKVFARRSGIDFIDYMHHVILRESKKIVLSQKEHKDSMWVDPIKALEMDLIPDGYTCLKLFLKYKELA